MAFRLTERLIYFLAAVNFFVAATLSQTETYPATVVTALLAGKAILARILFRAFPGFFGDIHLALQSGYGYK